MTEQQRREQIMKARAQEQQRQNVPAMSDAEALKIASEQGALTKEQMVVAALIGKMVNTDLGDIRKMHTDGGAKIGQVDMSKVMPSGIAKARNMPPPNPVPAPPPNPVPAPPPNPVPVQAPVVPPVPFIGQEQLELDFNKTARYDDIYNKLLSLEDRIIILTEKVDKLLLVSNIENNKLRTPASVWKDASGVSSSEPSKEPVDREESKKK